MSRSCSSSDMTTCSTMVDANNSRAAAVASGEPASTKMTCRPESSSVLGPNIGCSEVTRQPCDLRALRPARSGDLREPTSKITPLGRRMATSRRILSVTPSGVAMTMKSWSAPRCASPEGARTPAARPRDRRFPRQNPGTP